MIRFENGGTAHLRHLRRWLELLLGEAATVDVQLVLSELATNAFQHGTGPVEIEVDYGEDLRLRVTNRAEQAPVVRDQMTIGPRGRGLAIVVATASGVQLEFEDGLAVVTCTFAGHGNGAG